jgi:hypothetical protein
MSTIVTRAGKGSALTHTEVDANFTNLNTDKLQSGDTAATLTITSADINGGTIDGTSIGSSSASTGAFTTLSATGVTTVQAGTVSAPAITTSGDTNTGIFFPAADTIAFTEGGVESMRIDSSGNLGLGITPSAWSGGFKGLQVGNAAALAGYSGNFAWLGCNWVNDGSSNKYINTGFATLYEQSSGQHVWLTAPSGTAGNAITFTQAMTLDSSGALLVGTTTKLSEKLDVRGTALGNDTALIQNDNSTTFASSVLTLGATRTTTNSTFNFLTCVTQGVAYRLYIRDSGNVQNQNNSYGAISDIKLKENIVDATPKLAKLNQVRVVNYNLIGEGQKQLGVIAQELEQVFPGMVEETPDRDADGNDLGTVTKAVKYSVFVPMLIKAIQEQQQMINELKAEVAALKGA